MPPPSNDPRVKWFFARRFCLRQGEAPDLARASGDSGFVSHLAASTHGATGWDWSFRLVRPGQGWAFVSDGRVTLFLDEPGQYVPGDAKPGDLVAVRLPRARENLHPHRFTAYGGQGGVVLGPKFTKFFLPLRYEMAPALVDAFTSKGGDSLRFALHVCNSPSDYQRADSAIVDVGANDEVGVMRVLTAFLKARPDALSPRGAPAGTVLTESNVARAEGNGRGDVGDGFGWRVSSEAAAAGR
jgi:hypothetical protein